VTLSIDDKLRGSPADRARQAFSEITSLRKSGRIDEAYELGKTSRAQFPADSWVLGAFGWCVVELVKRHANTPASDDFKRYLGELADLPVQPSDKVLQAQRERWLSLADEAGRDAERARQSGKQGDHEGAIAIFSQIADAGKLRDADRMSFGWELCHATQAVIKSGNGPTLAGAQIGKARRHIANYFKLGLSGPDLLHSRIAQQALALSKAGHVKIVPLARIWDLHCFRLEDHERFRTDGGKTLPALSESLVNLVAKEAAANGTDADVEFVLPHAERISEKFPDNQWLKMNRVKLLSRLGRDEDARSLAVEFVRAKSREFWAWDLLGDLLEDRATKVACYAKALTCSSDDAFTGQVRLKFAEGISGEHPGEARTEIERVIEASRAAGHRVPAKAEELTHRGWYIQAEPSQVTAAFYDKWSDPADDFLLAQLPKRLAVIDHVNHERKLFHFIVDKGVDGVAPFTTFGKAPKEGQVVRVRVDTVTGPDGGRTSLLSIDQTDELIPSHLGKNFRDEVRVSNGMGFMPDNIFISSAMITAGGIGDGDIVEGMALLNFDKKKQRWGLKALQARRALSAQT
jgi:hypothetical protein